MLQGTRYLTKKVKSKGGRSMIWWPPMTSAGALYFVSGRVRGKWRWIVDNQLGHYGETDFDKRVVRINLFMHKVRRESLIDTLLHEELHILFPRYGEKRICALTEQRLKRLSPKQKARLYRLVRRYKPPRKRTMRA
jgi:hypothetical protein